MTRSRMLEVMAPGLLLCGLALLCAQTARADALLDGCRWLRDGQPELASDSFSAAISEDSECATAYVGRGAASLQLGELADARSDFQAASLLEPALASARSGLSAVWVYEGRYQDALTAYRGMLALDLADRNSVRAAAAYMACALGLYSSAAQEASAVCAQDPTNQLAAYTLAAAQLAQSQTRDAQAALQFVLSRPQPASGVAVPSCLFAPGTRYFDEQGLGQVVQAAAAVVAAPATGSGALSILSPSPNAILRGPVEIRIQASSGRGISYIALLLDNQFCGVSNVIPFNMRVDTTQVADGIRELRADAYSPTGIVIASVAITVRVDNGDRTLAPSETDVRRTADRFLQAALALKLEPMEAEHLRGRLLEREGKPDAAVAAYEYAFSYAPALPVLKADLLRAYRLTGLDVPSVEHDIHRLPPGVRSVGLTFDDGPNPVVTPWILDLLDKYHAHATFFLVGKQVEQYPELVAEIVARGHEVACHSYTHRNLKNLDELEVEREIVRTRAAIRRACGVVATRFRPPGGHYDPGVRRAAATWGFTTVFWDANILDYTTTDPLRITAGLSRDIKPGSIVLMHNGEDATLGVLPLLLPELKRRGLQMVSVSDAYGGAR